MSLFRISAALQSPCADLDTDEAAVKSTAQETQANPTEETKACPESRGRWIGQGLKALASILEERTNDKVVADGQPGDSTVEETAQTGKAKCHLGRGMRALLRD